MDFPGLNGSDLRRHLGSHVCEFHAIHIGQGLTVPPLLPVVVAAFEHTTFPLTVEFQRVWACPVRPFDEVSFKGPVVQHQGRVVEHMFRNSNLCLFEMEFYLIRFCFFDPIGA